MTTTKTAESQTEPDVRILGTWDHDLRLVALPFVPDVVTNLLPVGVTVLYADPGLGKSMLAQGVEHYIAYGTAFGEWEAADPARCLIVDLEGDPALTQERGFSMTAFGQLPTDLDERRPEIWDGAGGIFHLREHRTGEFGIDGNGIAERYIMLDRILTEARDEGNPFRYVRIDTMRDFIGSKPADTNAYDWDKQWITELNRLAKHHGVAMLLLHHTNKAGLVSGSQGISAAGECTISLKLNPEVEGECLLKSEKTRRGAPFEYAVRMDRDGVWQFDPDLKRAQVGNVGLCRKIVDILARGASTIGELRQALYDATANGLKSALHRLAGRREARYVRGAWELTEAPAPVTEGPRMRFCTICQQRMTVIDPAVTTHPTCTPPPPEDLPEPEPEDRPWSGTRELKESVAQSKFHPVPVIRKTERDQKPWNLITEQMDGHFGWTSSVEPGERVAILDRNGSYPSVCNAVPVAANVLRHSGQLAGRGRTAGIYLIDPVVWEHGGLPHPLGRTATSSDRRDGRIWVTTPHLIFLERLAERKFADGRPMLTVAPHIRDSWTGPVTHSLFEAFSESVKSERERARGESEEAYFHVKRSSSIAIRGLWPKAVNSPFWRPDWHQSVKAEAAVRLWVRACQAVEAGAELVRLAVTDEAAFAAPLTADRDWAPEPIILGAGYGQYKHTQLRLRDGTEVDSPVTAAQWSQRRGR